MTEDKVRDLAGRILGFTDSSDAKSGVGQITSFNSLGFSGIKDRPDGWYLPSKPFLPAIILETKSTSIPLKQVHIDELLKNCKIARTKYKNVVGILYNGDDIMVFLNGLRREGESELQNKEYYLGLFSQDRINKGMIYLLTKRINDSLHIDFGIKNLYHRMIFTACALVAKRYGASLVAGMNYQTFHTSIHSTLAKSLEEERKQNQKIDILLDVYSEIKMNSTENQEAIDNFIDWVSQISDNINSDFWNGEDVMGIFFNEFNRYKKKSEHGQVFTPDHITSLMYRLVAVDKNDLVGDFACGSGAFLVKSMCNMIKEAGGVNTHKATEIQKTQLYGIEFDREIFALACANMLIHKDGKTNLRQLDTRSEEASRWIESIGITKILMNPPFEEKYGCMKIVTNVLDSVPAGTKCAFILPDKKLEKHGGKKLLKKHSLDKIIKLPEKTFNEGVTTSIFIFTAGKPHKDKSIFACYISEDGLETVKNQGRQDIRNRWQDIEDYWVEVIRRQSGDDSIQWVIPTEHMSYQMPKPPFELFEEDFVSVLMDYELFKRDILSKDFKEEIANKILYQSHASEDVDKFIFTIPKESNHEEN
ncbi:HsdM family class I SAM-dependent methyltransferase [Bacteroides acidifaciens]|uniref:HsdM family class I SAM-dependent methyltransferase n=1 Tax=Bacteroides acidifaciens TaxID=85831 RepID=UPI0025B264D4|nr:N-6 DNA methylase [Bacteroides acidifaciens]